MARFRAIISPADPATGCGLWRGMPGDDGYGTFSWQGPDGTRWKYRAHRLALSLDGPAPFADAYALHACNTPLCCSTRPGHLYWGTARDNAADRDRAAGSILWIWRYSPSRRPHQGQVAAGAGLNGDGGSGAGGSTAPLGSCDDRVSAAASAEPGSEPDAMPAVAGSGSLAAGSGSSGRSNAAIFGFHLVDLGGQRLEPVAVRERGAGQADSTAALVGEIDLAGLRRG